MAAKSHGKKKSLTVHQLAAWVAKLDGSIEELQRAVHAARMPRMEPARRTWGQWLRGVRR